MRNILAILLMIFAMVPMLCGCNYQMVDTKYTFDRAIIQLPDGTIVDGKVQSWRDYEDGDQIQVKIDGVTYLVHAADVALIDE